MIKRIVDRFHSILKREAKIEYDPSLCYEYCPRCDANLTLQKGYDNLLPYWKCLGCGEMLINPQDEAFSGVVWICDQCNALLNNQVGFHEKSDEWKCAECGYINEICTKEIYSSDDEYQTELFNPYRGLNDEDLLELSLYEDIDILKKHQNVILTKRRDTGELFVKKLLTTFNLEVYHYLMEHPVRHMPRIFKVFEAKESLVVLEEYIHGKTLDELLAMNQDSNQDKLQGLLAETNAISKDNAIAIAIEICSVLSELHHLDKPIVHRDIKPSNIIITDHGEAWLLDVNVAKWHDPAQKDDTKYMGTWPYAAPEQVGYGMKSSSPKADIYAVGILLNVMITGKFPKEEKAPDEIWKIIERCIRLEAEERYTVQELIETLGSLLNSHLESW